MIVYLGCAGRKQAGLRTTEPKLNRFSLLPKRASQMLSLDVLICSQGPGYPAQVVVERTEGFKMIHVLRKETAVPVS